MPPILWTDAESDYLIRQRRHRNDEYHNIPGRSQGRFWESVARRVNRHFGRRRRRYMSRQCEQKWKNLVRDYRVSNKINNNNNEISFFILVFFLEFL